MTAFAFDKNQLVGTAENGQKTFGLVRLCSGEKINGFKFTDP
jgi:hypothetical protein